MLLFLHSATQLSEDFLLLCQTSIWQSSSSHWSMYSGYPKALQSTVTLFDSNGRLPRYVFKSVRK